MATQGISSARPGKELQVEVCELSGWGGRAFMALQTLSIGCAHNHEAPRIRPSHLRRDPNAALPAPENTHIARSAL